MQCGRCAVDNVEAELLIFTQLWCILFGFAYLLIKKKIVIGTGSLEWYHL